MKNPVLALLVLCSTVVAAASDNHNEMFKAYSERDFTKAKKLAARHSSDPESRLVHALILLHDKTNFQMVAGLHELKALQNATFSDPNLKLQADLALARTAQLVDLRRDIYGDAAKDIDFNGIYEKILRENHDSLEACFALTYKLFPVMEEGSKAEADQAFAELEAFLLKYRGSAQHLAPLHLFADDEYVGVRGDYRNGVRHLVAAYNAGISNPRIRQDTLFRIGRYYDHRLNDRANAEKYYNEYLRLYPMSNRAPVVQRMLGELVAKNKPSLQSPAASSASGKTAEVK